MKKKLEAELISIAHRVLQLKNKENIRELHHEAQKLYEKLSVLLFVEENFGDVKPTIGLYEVEAKLEKAFDFDEKIIVAEIKEDKKELIVDSKVDSIISSEESKEIVLEEVIIEESKNEIESEKKLVEDSIIEIPKIEKKQVSLDDFLSNMQSEPIFERVSDSNKSKETVIPVEIAKMIEEKINSDVKVETDMFFAPKEITFEKTNTKPFVNLNDQLNKSINIGLNDKLAFEKHLFDGSAEDFNRVVSQISTYDSLEDAKNFIDDLVKPDYNNWKGKEEFADRFMEFVASKFV